MISVSLMIGFLFTVNLIRNHYLLAEFQQKTPDFLINGYKLYFSTLEKHGNTLAIKGLGFRDSGLHIRAKNSSESTELIKITGRAIKKASTLRIQINSEQPSYAQAPNGEFYFTLGLGESVDFLIYSKKYEYSLIAISKEKCTTCAGHNSFRESIIKERPELGSLINEGNWEGILNSLLDFSANRVVLGITERSDIAYTFQAKDLTYAFSHNLSEGSCGLFSDYFRKVIKEFGFESATVDFGINANDNLTHVTVVVLAPDGRYYVFDPTFNATFRSVDGRLADIERSLNQSDVLFHESGVLRDVVWKKKDLDSLAEIDYVKFNQYDIAKCRDMAINESAFSLCPKIPYSSKFLEDVWHDRLAKNNVNMDADLFRVLMKNGAIYSVNSDSNKVKDELTELLKKIGIKFH